MRAIGLWLSYQRAWDASVNIDFGNSSRTGGMLLEEVPVERKQVQCSLQGEDGGKSSCSWLDCWNIVSIVPCWLVTGNSVSHTAWNFSSCSYSLFLCSFQPPRSLNPQTVSMSWCQIPSQPNIKHATVCNPIKQARKGVCTAESTFK